ncbi:MAG: hypothetical protein K6E19_03940, partial [Lachnospiraceae bacterium]|nr:hypothetical protein [Lachnospiraceae bacterium]
MKKKLLATVLTCALAVTSLTACGGETAQNTPASQNTQTETSKATETKTEEKKEEKVELTGIDLIISEAEGMTMEELAKKAI